MSDIESERSQGLAKFSMATRVLLLVAALLAGSGVMLGAYAAHGMQDMLAEKGFGAATVSKKLDQAEVGVRYQMFHALAILVIAATGLGARSRLFVAAAFAFILGVLLFSGTLYAIALADSTMHLVVPFGGLAMTIGWGLLAIGAFTAR